MPPFPRGAQPNGMASSVLDGPPPNPLNPSFSALQDPAQANPSMPGSRQPMSRDLPPEVLTGLLKAGESVTSMMDDIAAMVPDVAPDIAGARDLFMRALAKLTLAGGDLGATQASSQFVGSAPNPGQSPQG